MDASAAERGAAARLADLEGALAGFLAGALPGLFADGGEDAWVEEADFEDAPRAARVALGPVFLLVFLDIAASITPSLRRMRLFRHDHDAIPRRLRSPNAGRVRLYDELVDNRPIPQQHTRPKPWWRNW